MSIALLVGALSPSTSAQIFLYAGGSTPPTRTLNSSFFGTPPAFIALGAGGLAYVANEGKSTAGVTSVRVASAGSSAPTAQALGFAPTDEPCHVALHPSGSWVFTASYGAGTVSVLPVDGSTGVARAPSTVVAPAGPAAAAHEVVFAGEDDVYVPLLGADSIACFKFNATSGALSLASLFALPAGSGPRHLALHPLLSTRVYALCELSSSVIPLTRDAATGALSATEQSPLSIVRPGMPTPDVQAACDVLISSDGRFLYATNRAAPFGSGDNSIFSIPLLADGSLGGVSSWVGADEINFPRHASFVNGGSLLAVANQKGGDVGIYSRDGTTGQLVFVSAIDCGGAPASWVGQVQ